MARKKRIKKIRTRNWIAVHAHQRGGAGGHRNREDDVRKGRSRKAKHRAKRFDD